MRLTDLEPEWIADYGEALRSFRRGCAITLGDAQGIIFLCPACFAANKGPVGTHSVLCWFRDRGVPDDAVPGPGRWTPTGRDFYDLSLQPSVALPSGCGWHGWVKDGEVT